MEARKENTAIFAKEKKKKKKKAGDAAGHTEAGLWEKVIPS
jgi:hypothetical protein